MQVDEQRLRFRDAMASLAAAVLQEVQAESLNRL